MIKYRIFKDSASLIIDGEAFSLEASHPRYLEILDLVRAQNQAEVLAILNHQELLNLGLEIKDGSVYYKNLALPNFFYNKFLKIKTKKDLIPIINTWYKLENSLSLLDKKRFGIYFTESYLAWDDTAQNYLYASGDKIFDHFTFFQVENSSLFSKIRSEHTSVVSYVKSIWANATTSVIQEIQRICTQESNRMELSFIAIGSSLSELSPEECLETLKKIELRGRNINALISLAPFMLSQLSKNQIKKFLPELLKTGDILTNFRELKNLNPTYTLPDFSTIDELRAIITREIKKFDGNEFSLQIDITNPDLFAINNIVIGDELKIIIPTLNKQLIDWGNSLSHCIGGYGKRIAQGKTYCFAIYNVEKDVVLYTIEYHQGRIIQFRGKRNETANMINKGHYHKVIDFLITKGLVLDKKNISA